MSNLVSIMEQIRKIKNNIGVQALLDEAYRILGNPLVMFDTEFKLLAYTEVITDDPFWNEIVTQGMFGEQTLRLFENEGFMEDVANNPRIAFMKSDKIKYDRIVGKIFNKNNTFVSALLIVECNKPFEENDCMCFEAVCKLMSREISNIEFYQEYEQSHQETIIRNLIDRNYDMRLDVAQVGILYADLESNLYTVVVDISLCDPEYAKIVYFRDLFRQTEPAYKYAIYANYIIIIISTNDEALRVNKALKSLITVFEENNLYAGISSRFENLFELEKYYNEAVDAMRLTMDLRSSQRIFPCEERSLEKMEKINQLPNGMGIQYFLNKGLEIFGNPLLFHDMEPNLLGYTENVEITDPIWQELVTYGTGSDATVELFQTEGWVDIMDKTRGGALLVSDKCKYDRISWRIYNSDNIRFGCTSIVNTLQPFSEDELVLFGTFSQKFSKEVKKIELYNKIGQVYSGTIINKLISGKIDDYTFYSTDIGNLYDNFMDDLYLIVVDTSQCDSDQINLMYFRDLFNWPNTLNRYAIYDDYIVIITSSIDNVPLNESEELKQISKVFAQNNIYAGISSRFENLYDLQKHYAAAVSALQSGMEQQGLHGKQRIFHCDDC